MNIRVAIYGMMMVWLLASCNSQTRYHQFRHIDQAAWRQSDTLSFDIPLTDSLLTHELTLQLRHTSRYRYRDLSIGLVVLSPDSQVAKTMSYNVPLVNQDGYWIGSGQGGLYQMDIGQAVLPRSSAGTWHVYAFHTMSDSILVGVNDIGVKVQRSE